MQGGRQLLSVDYEVACRSSLVMFCHCAALSRIACNTKSCLFDQHRTACSEAVCVQDLRELVRAIKAKYPSICAEGLRRLHEAVGQGFIAGGEDRGVLTLRRIAAHHYDGSGRTTRCPSLPPLCALGVGSIQNVGPLIHAAADIESAGEDSVDFGGETCVDSEAEDSADITNLTATGVPTNADENGVEAVVDRVNAFAATWQQSNASSGSGMQREAIQRNVMTSADDFIQYLGRLEADLEQIHLTTPLDQRDRVRGALGTLMSTAAEFYCKKQIADITSESVRRLAALRAFHGSNGAFLELSTPRNKD